MPSSKKVLKICSNGHRFYKSSDCLTCPVCEADKKPKAGFLSTIAAPARRALESKGISTLKKLSEFTEDEISALHGMGPNAISKLKVALKKEGLSYKKQSPEITSKNDSSEDSVKNTETESVDNYMLKLKHPMGKVASEIRKIILSSDKLIGEEIKWNAPAFFYTGKMKSFDPKKYQRHIVVFNFFKNDCLRLIFLKGSLVADKSGLLEGDFKDERKIALFYDLKDLKAKEKDLQRIIKATMTLFKK